MRIAAHFWIENVTQHPHRIEAFFAELLGHQINFLHADAMFTGDAAAEFDALV